jgi:predicted enzyme related to lactoylglutathione lyase
VEFERYDDGVPSWVDLNSPDMAKSKEFYGGLFGWNCPEGPAEAGGYSVCDLNGKTVAGIGPQMTEGMPPMWTTYVNVDSADDATAKVKANGGNVFVEPMDVMDVGRMAVFADPLGAVIAVWQPGQHTGAQLANEPGTFGWNELITTDLDKSKAFYKAVFGWDAADQGPPGGPPAYTEWKLGERSVGGMMLKQPEMPADMPPNWGVYFVVEDTDATVDKVKGLGGTVFMGPTDIEPGRFAVIADNIGAVFNVIAMKPEAASAG